MTDWTIHCEKCGPLNIAPQESLTALYDAIDHVEQDCKAEWPSGVTPIVWIESKSQGISSK